MSEIELATGTVREIEELLEVRFGARGHDAGQKLYSVEIELPPEIVSRIRFIVSVRDMLISESGSRMLSTADFMLARNEAVDWLRHNRSDRQIDRKHSFLSSGRGKLFLPVLLLGIIIIVLTVFAANSLRQTHGDEEKSIRLPQIYR